MVKHKKHYSKGGFGGFGGGKKIFGLGTKGLIGGLGVLGVAGAVFFADQIADAVPINVPYKKYAVAFAIGGPAGLAGKVAKDYIMPTVGAPVSSGGITLY